MEVIGDHHKELFSRIGGNESYTEELPYKMGKEELETAMDNPLEGFSVCLYAAGND